LQQRMRCASRARPKRRWQAFTKQVIAIRRLRSERDLVRYTGECERYRRQLSELQWWIVQASASKR
jgi:hypothetical protein